MGAAGLDRAEGLTRARALLGDADRVVVLTGAGISAESGVPTFRGAGGLWKTHRPEELATPAAFARDPCLVWEWYAWRRSVVAACGPNDAHRALARLALSGRPATTLITQNVDGLHHRAALEIASDEDASAALPLELHGAVHRDRCSRCGIRTRWLDQIDVATPASLPRCACGGLLRPDVVWFGEAPDAEVLEAGFDAARAADVCLVVGTSALVYPAAAVPEVTLANGGVVVEVNVEATPLTPAARVSLRGPAASLVPALTAEPSSG